MFIENVLESEQWYEANLHHGSTKGMTEGPTKEKVTKKGGGGRSVSLQVEMQVCSVSLVLCSFLRGRSNQKKGER